MAVRDYPEWYVYKPCPTCGQMRMVYDKATHDLCLHLTENAHKFLSGEIKTYEGCYISEETQNIQE